MAQTYLPVPTFDYSSAFDYRSCLSAEYDGLFQDEQLYGRPKPDALQRFAYYLLTAFAFLFFLLTVPVSSFFCLKKVHSLQRCLTYRLGNRLPLKGPGYILKLPFIDHISIIDLYEEHFNIIDSEEQILTGDGSIISIRPCQASLNVIDAVKTTLKIGQIDVKECLRLRFANVIRSKHVEDLENKMDFVTRLFEENCNKFLQRWGYSFKLDELPRITVVERADPINPIKSKLTKLLSPDEANPSSPAEALLGLLGPLAPPSLTAAVQSTWPAPSEVVSKKTPNELCSLTDEELSQAMPVLQTFLDQYKAYLTGFSSFTIEVTITDHSTELRRHQFFQYINGSIQGIAIAPSQANLSVQFESYANFERFLFSEDIKYLQYSFNY